MPSASERLRELDLGPGSIDDAELITMGYEGLIVLREVRSLIADVVEAAEKWTGSSMMNEPETYGAIVRKCVADLTALREALEEK